MKFEPLNYYSPARIREMMAIPMSHLGKLEEDDAGIKFISGRSLPFSLCRLIGIYGTFSYGKDLYIFRREDSPGVFAYTTVDATKIILIKD